MNHAVDKERVQNEQETCRTCAEPLHQHAFALYVAQAFSPCAPRIDVFEFEFEVTSDPKKNTSASNATILDSSDQTDIPEIIR